MGRIAGIYFPDEKPITSQLETDFRAGFNMSGADADLFRGRGVLMGQSVSARQHSTPDQSELPPLVGSACVWEGRLDEFDGVPVASAATRVHLMLLRRFSARREKCFTDFVGDWSAALWHDVGDTLYLASDYAGTRPLYYCFNAGGWCWASSLRDLVRWSGAELLDVDYAAEFIRRGTSSERTPYRGVLVVPAGCFVRIRRGEVSVQHYWTPDLAREIHFADDREYEQRLRALFEQAVASRLRSHGTVAVELSGGLDSTSVACAAHRAIQNAEVEADRVVTLSYREHGSADDRFVERIRQRLRLESVQIDLDDYPFLSEAMPGDSQPTLWEPRLREVARRLKVMNSRALLTGRAGDLSMGNWHDDSEQVADFFCRGQMIRGLREAFAWSRYLCLPLGSVLCKAVRDMAPVKHEAFGIRLNEIPPSRRKRLIALEELLQSRTLQCPEALQGVDYTHPLAHRPLVEFMMKVPSAIVCRAGEPRRLMRKAIAGIVPDFICRRRSKTAYDAVFLRALRPLAAEMLRNLHSMELATWGCVEVEDWRTPLEHLVAGLATDAARLRHVIGLEFWLRQRSRAARRNREQLCIAS